MLPQKAYPPSACPVLIIDSAIVANTTDQLEGANAAEFSDALRSESARSARGFEAAPAPALISSNFDTASKIPLGVDVAMDCWFGGKDRTMEDLQGIVRAAGLRIAHVTHTRSSQWSESPLPFQSQRRIL